MAKEARAELVRQAAAAATRYVATAQLAGQTRAREAGLSLHSMDATVLALLRVHGPLTPRQLASLAGVSSSGTITGAIDRLERAGWTTRTPCQVDRRKVFVTLTDAADHGRAIEVSEALTRYSDDQLATITTFFDQLSQPPSPTED